MEIEQLKKVRKQMLDDWLKSCPFVFVDRTNPYGNDEHLTKIIFNLSKLKKESKRGKSKRTIPGKLEPGQSEDEEIFFVFFQFFSIV